MVCTMLCGHNANCRRLSICLATLLCAGSVAAQSLPVGSQRVNPKDGLTYVWIPPGTFTMGCSPGDADCYAWEKPAHRVVITKGFWIGQTEVTQDAYGRVSGSYPGKWRAKVLKEIREFKPPAGVPPPPPPVPDFTGPSLPAQWLTWEEARDYCTAAGMRLPTEAEWEYAARGGNASARYAPLDKMAWYEDNSKLMPHPVASKKPNGYGLYDAVGNVAEWVADWFDEKYYASSSGIDPKGPPKGDLRTTRSGSGLMPRMSARVSYRTGEDPTRGSLVIGVRCAGNQLR